MNKKLLVITLVSLISCSGIIAMIFGIWYFVTLNQDNETDSDQNKNENIFWTLQYQSENID